MRMGPPHYRAPTPPSYRRRVPVERWPDAYWQKDPPAVLQYRVGHLHFYGWIPFVTWRNVKATVLGGWCLLAQGLVYCLWTFTIHVTNGLGIAHHDQAPFIKLFGTPWMGAILNLNILVTFSLAIFVTLVLKRWWDTRETYLKVKGTIMELAMLFTNNITFNAPIESHRYSIDYRSAAAAAAAMASSRATTPSISGQLEPCRNQTCTYGADATVCSELVRYLNLGHLLLLNAANFHACLFNNPSTASSNLPHAVVHNEYSRSPLPSNGAFSRIIRHAARFTCTKDNNSDEHIDESGVTPLTQFHTVLTKEDFEQEGLITEDEWLILQGAANTDLGHESLFLPLVVYGWISKILLVCSENQLVVQPGNLKMMMNCMSQLRSASSRVLLDVTTQLPYVYVSLVSFTVHIHLLLLSTWMGFFFSCGFPASNELQLYPVQTFSISGEAIFESGSPRQPLTLLGFDGFATGEGSHGPMHLNSWLIIFTGYGFLMLANLIFQGFLEIHTILDNPFGHHPCKFPMLTETTDLLRCSKHLRDSSVGLNMPSALKQTIEKIKNH